MLLDLAIIDLDNTLYAADNGVFARMDRRMNRFVGDALGVDMCEANVIRQRYWRMYGTTLKGMMLHHDTDPEAFLDDVHNIDVHEVLSVDTELDQALSMMSCRKIIHTNGTHEHAMRVLQALGISHHFDEIYDIRFNAYEPKPDRETLSLLLAEEGGVSARTIVVDDMVANLIIARDLGMKTAWISSELEHGGWHYQVRSFHELPLSMRNE